MDKNKMFQRSIFKSPRPKDGNPNERFEVFCKRFKLQKSRDSVPKTTLQLKAEKSSEENRK